MYEEENKQGLLLEDYKNKNNTINEHPYQKS